MMSGVKGGPTLARDTVYAVVMIVCTGLIGPCILLGGLRYRESFNALFGSCNMAPPRCSLRRSSSG
jgi:Ca2+:H+ antiporter